MLRYTSGSVLHGSNIREALEAASAILVAEGYPPITIVSGDREYDEQVAIFLARYVLVSQVNGRRVYDFRWWEGRQYARISSAGTVAAPSPTAPHIARIAADLGYPYNDRSTAAHRRLQQIAPGLGLTWTGQYFGEDWHWETNRGVGRIDFGGTPAGNQSEEDDMDISEIHNWRQITPGDGVARNLLDMLVYSVQRQEEINTRQEQIVANQVARDGDISKAVAGIKADIAYIHTVSPVSLAAIYQAAGRGEVKLTDVQVKAIGDRLNDSLVSGLDAALRDDFDGVLARMSKLPAETLAALKSKL